MTMFCDPPAIAPDPQAQARDRLSGARADDAWTIDDLRRALAVLALATRSAEIALQDVADATSAQAVRDAWRASNTMLVDAVRVIETHATTLNAAVCVMLTES